MRKMWDVIKARDYALIAVCGPKILIGEGDYALKIIGGPTDYVYGHHETFNKKQILKLRGLLYHWAGAMMLGTKTVTKTTTTKTVAGIINE